MQVIPAEPLAAGPSQQAQSLSDTEPSSSVNAYDLVSNLHVTAQDLLSLTVTCLLHSSTDPHVKWPAPQFDTSPSANFLNVLQVSMPLT